MKKGDYNAFWVFVGMLIAISALMAFLMVPVEATGTQEASQEEHTEVLQPDTYVAPDPCHLTTVICDYERTNNGGSNHGQAGGVGETTNQDSGESKDVTQLIRDLSESSDVGVETALRIARCESSLNPEARNPNSSATGLYQWTTGSWAYIGGPTKYGDRTDPVASTKAFLDYYPSHPGWWECK